MSMRRRSDIDRLSDTDLADALFSFDWDEGACQECPDPETVWEAACGRLVPQQQAKIADHAAGCPRCAHDLQAARRMAEDLGELEPIPVPILVKVWTPIQEYEARAAAAFGIWRVDATRWVGERAVEWRLAVAASALTAAVCITVLSVLRPPEPWPVPGGYRSDIGPVVELLLHDGQTLARDHFVLEWLGLEGARYDVRVMTADLDEIAVVSDLAVPELQLDEKDLAGLAAGTMLLCQVDAYLPNGRRLTSHTHQVRLE